MRPLALGWALSELQVLFLTRARLELFQDGALSLPNKSVRSARPADLYGQRSCSVPPEQRAGYHKFMAPCCWWQGGMNYSKPPPFHRAPHQPGQRGNVVVLR